MNSPRDELVPNAMRARRLHVDTYQEPVVYMREDCVVCRSEGFAAQARVQIDFAGRRVVATLNVVHGDWLAVGDAGLSESAWGALLPTEGATLIISQALALDSLSHVRAKIYGHRLDPDALGVRRS